jgi:hypothetical protein
MARHDDALPLSEMLTTAGGEYLGQEIKRAPTWSACSPTTTR